jgi:hypothetical protein
MRTSLRLVLAAGALLGAATVAQADCVTKAGKGTGSTDDDAKFQAWEAVLQATSWGSWANWMATSKTVGTAPGYKVSNLRSRCGAGGFLGRECTVGAKLCS